MSSLFIFIFFHFYYLLWDPDPWQGIAHIQGESGNAITDTSKEWVTNAL